MDRLKFIDLNNMDIKKIGPIGAEITKINLSDLS